MTLLEKRVADERKIAGKETEVEAYKGLRRGWCFSGSEFKEELKEGLLGTLDKVSRDSIVGEPRRMHDEYEAEHLLQQACEFVGLILDEKDLLRKNDLRKELVSWFLSKKTPVTQEWMARKLGMGSRANVSRAVQRIDQGMGAEIAKKKAGLNEMYRCVH
jgi:biotin operon repressor